MNVFKKIYCRCFQAVFKLAIPILPYRNPYVMKSCTEVPGVLKSKNIDSVLIVTDEFLHSSGIIDTLKNSLKKAGIKYTVYDKTVPNPTVSNVEEARQEYIKKKCNALIGFGGGSSIDAAKAVGARITRAKMPISKMEGILKIFFKTPFTVAIPTTAGTGSEVTVTTVITDDATHHKFPISDFCLIPDACVLDGEITKSLPPHLTSTTGMDALVHAIEAYIGRSDVKASRSDALEAIKLISENLYVAYTNGTNLEARKNMLRAAFLAGRAFSKSYVGYCHGIAHSLGGEYGIAHGLANAVLLPYTLESYGNTIYKKAKVISVIMGFAKESDSEKTATGKLIKGIRYMNQKMNIPTHLSGIRREDIPRLASYADKESNPLYPVPKLMDKNELTGIYYAVMEEE